MVQQSDYARPNATNNSAALVAEFENFDTISKPIRDIKINLVTKVQSVFDLIWNDILNVQITLLEALKCEFLDPLIQ